jgi:hypothetical protein
MKRRIIFAVVASSVLAACATPYQERGLSSGVRGLLGGVQASRIDETTIQISTRGNAYTSAETITLYALRKAAEETLAYGYDGFYVVSDQDRTRRITEYTPGSATTNFSGTVMGTGNNSAFVTGSGTTSYSPGETTTYVKPGSALTVKMFKGPKPNDAPGVYDARDLLRFLVPPQPAK